MSVGAIFAAFGVMFIVLSVHEGGHLGAGALLGRPICNMEIGCGPKLYGFVVRGINIRVFAFPLSGRVTFAFPSARRWKNVVVLAAGPAANIVAGILLFAPFHDLAVASLCVGVGSLIPFRDSDGAQLLKLWRTRARMRAPA